MRVQGTSGVWSHPALIYQVFLLGLGAFREQSSRESSELMVYFLLQEEEEEWQ